MNQCPRFWTEDPAILFRQYYDFFPFHQGARKCTTTALNSFTRFGIYLGIILSVLRGNIVYMMISVAIIIVAMASYYGMKSKGIVREDFAVAPSLPQGLPTTPDLGSRDFVKGIEAAGKAVEDVIGISNRTDVKDSNPFMNVLLTEIGDDPLRSPARTDEFLKRQFSNQFQDRIYGDPGDVFQHTQNQRIWEVNPSTSIPNDQQSFQNWLFRVPGKTCKEGNTRVCKTGSEGGQLTWLSQA
jgi:hypothetical protein